jgi:hypothetical protein
MVRMTLKDRAMSVVTAQKSHRRNIPRTQRFRLSWFPRKHGFLIGRFVSRLLSHIRHVEVLEAKTDLSDDKLFCGFF